MIAFKFRPATQLGYAFDIILNDRLYCADWSALNDPMEGMFAFDHKSANEADGKRTVADIIREKKQLRVCSLSETFDSHLLWSHYASGFTGLAIEVELPDDSPVVRRVNYRSEFEPALGGSEIDAPRAATEILCSKYKEWAYEKEVRIIQQDVHFPLAAQPAYHVIAGHRMEPALFKALDLICCSMAIRLTRTKITPDGISVIDTQ